MLEVSVSDPKGQLTDLVRNAEEGGEVVLTRFGRPVVRLQPIRPKLSPKERQALLEEQAAAGHTHATPGPSAARSQDFLYDENGLPA